MLEQTELRHNDSVPPVERDVTTFVTHGESECSMEEVNVFLSLQPGIIKDNWDSGYIKEETSQQQWPHRLEISLYKLPLLFKCKLPVLAIIWNVFWNFHTQWTSFVLYEASMSWDSAWSGRGNCNKIRDALTEYSFLRMIAYRIRVVLICMVLSCYIEVIDRRYDEVLFYVFRLKTVLRIL